MDVALLFVKLRNTLGVIVQFLDRGGVQPLHLKEIRTLGVKYSYIVTTFRCRRYTRLLLSVGDLLR